MKEKIPLKVGYTFCIISIFLPWFTFNAKVMGYCYGYQFLKWMIIPMLILGVYVFRSDRNKVLTILAEFSACAVLIVAVIAPGCWQGIGNIKGGVHWTEGIRTAVPTYWVSLICFVLFVGMIQYDLFQRKK